MATATTRKSKKGTIRINPDAQVWAKANGHEANLQAALDLVAAYKSRGVTPEKLLQRLAQHERAARTAKAQLATLKRADNS